MIGIPSKKIKEYAKKFFQHFKESIRVSNSRKTWTYLGIYMQTWSGIDEAAKLKNGPRVPMDFFLSDIGQTTGIFREEIMNLLIKETR